VLLPLIAHSLLGAKDTSCEILCCGTTQRQHISHRWSRTATLLPDTRASPLLSAPEDPHGARSDARHLRGPPQEQPSRGGPLERSHCRTLGGRHFLYGAGPAHCRVPEERRRGRTRRQVRPSSGTCYQQSPTMEQRAHCSGKVGRRVLI